MKKKNAQRFNMMLAVFLVVNGAQLIWQNLQSFADAFSRFTGKISDIEIADEAAHRNTKGVAIDKKQKRKTMTAFAMLVKGAIQAYATTISDNTLFKSVDYSTSKMMNGKSATALTCAKTIRDTGNTLIGQLAAFGITAQIITDFTAANTDFEQFISAPRQAIADRAVANKHEDQLVNDASNILENEMDKLMDNFKNSAPTFYNEYFQNRIISNFATHFTKVRVNITLQNDVPIYNAAVTVQSPTTGKVYNFSSDLSGVAEERVTHGIYNITVTKLGHPPVTINDVEVKLGQQKNLDIQLA